MNKEGSGVKDFFLVLCSSLLFLTLLLSSCNTGFLVPPPGGTGPAPMPPPFLTEEEKALIREYCLGGDIVVRWPDGDIGVYDATGNIQILQRVVNVWNSIIQSGGGRTRFYLSNDPSSPVRIYYDSSLPQMGKCGLSNGPVVDANYQIRYYELKISPQWASCGFPDTLYALFLRRFAQAAGIKKEKLCPPFADYNDCPYNMWTAWTSIPSEYAAAIRALYKVPPGYNLVQTTPFWTEITEIKGVTWNPKYQPTRYPFLLVDYCGRRLVGPPVGDKDYEYPQEYKSDFVIDGRLRFVLVILGKGFGNEKGRVWLEGRGMINGQPQHFRVDGEDILYWSDAKIVVCPYFDVPRYEPMREYDAELGIERWDRTASASRAISITPSIGKQPYGQCTWWTNLRLIEEKRVERCKTGAYDGSKPMEGYMPQEGDILIWDLEHHQAFVEEVLPGGRVKISQYNRGYSESYSEYITGEDRCYRFSDRSSCANRYIRF